MSGFKVRLRKSVSTRVTARKLEGSKKKKNIKNRRLRGEQSIHFFQSDTHAVISHKLAFTSLHCSISYYIEETLIRPDQRRT